MSKSPFNDPIDGHSDGSFDPYYDKHHFQESSLGWDDETPRASTSALGFERSSTAQLVQPGGSFVEAGDDDKEAQRPGLRQSYANDSYGTLGDTPDTGKPQGTHGFQDLEYQDPYSKPTATYSSPQRNPNDPPEKKGIFAQIANGRYPIEQQIENKKRGIGRQRYPFLVWALTVAMAGVLIYELVVNDQAQGTPVSFKPVVNPMLGPSSSALIQLGARFPPCMKNVSLVPVTLELPCLNDTANPPDQECPISQLCGFGGIQEGATPNQWFRFITPIFLHAGIIHYLLNMLAQLTVSAQVEREMGSAGFFILYFAAGIFGNVLGGNFALVGIPSVGASGAIFGTQAIAWIDLFAHWKYKYRPVRMLIFMIIELGVGIALGFIPYVDNFVHLGGFFMGLLIGTTLYPVISTSKRHKTIMWTLRIAAIPVAIILFVVLIRNFYTSDPYAACPGCAYLSCIPTSANNYCKGTGITTTTSSSTFRRASIFL